MATTLRPSLSINTQFHHQHQQSSNLSLTFRHPIPFPSSSNKPHLTTSRQSDRYSLPCTQSQTSTSPRSDVSLINPGRFLTGEELDKLKIIQNFSYYQELERGSMWVRVMKLEEMNGYVRAAMIDLFAKNGYVRAAMIDLFAKNCSFEDSLRVFYDVPCENVVCWNAIISAAVRNFVRLGGVLCCSCHS